jgi:hypothetical protein
VCLDAILAEKRIGRSSKNILKLLRFETKETGIEGLK